MQTENHVAGSKYGHKSYEQDFVNGLGLVGKRYAILS